LKKLFKTFVIDILGLKDENGQNGNTETDLSSEVIELLLKVRKQAKDNKNWALSDTIRDELNKLGIIVKDTAEGFEWSIK